MKVRYHTGFGLARDTARTVNRWPVIAEIDEFELRRPARLSGAATGRTPQEARERARAIRVRTPTPVPPGAT